MFEQAYAGRAETQRGRQGRDTAGKAGKLEEGRGVCKETGGTGQNEKRNEEWPKKTCGPRTNQMVR